MQGRQQQALIRKLEKAEAEALRFWNAAHETKQQRQYDLEQLTEIQNSLSQWASDREVLDVKIAIADAKESLKAAVAEDAESLHSYNAAASECASAEATLAEWSKTEAQPQAQISGLPHYDPHLGLEVR